MPATSAGMTAERQLQLTGTPFSEHHSETYHETSTPEIPSTRRGRCSRSCILPRRDGADLSEPPYHDDCPGLCGRLSRCSRAAPCRADERVPPPTHHYRK